MITDCGSKTCGIPTQDSPNRNIVWQLWTIFTHPHSKCPAWNGFLIAIILVVFGQALHFGFIFYDDFTYTLAKTDKGPVWSYSFLSWAITSMDDGFWAPITKISHRIDTHLFGRQAGGHHAVNLLLHIVNALLLWRFLCRITGGDGLIQFLAVGLFAIHPLRVEPVVWIASRKDLLSTLFLLGMLIKYIDWIQGQNKRDYLWSFCFFILSALSKPISIVFPLFLILLDVLWYKERTLFTFKRIFSYIPFWGVSIFLAVITFHAEQEAIIPVTLTMSEKVSRIIVATALYFLLTFVPIDLHIPYGIAYFPFFGWTGGIPVYHRVDIVITSLLILLVISFLWLLLRKEYRMNVLSLAFFIIPLIPVIGFIPFGHHLIADRFTYVSHIGLCILICTGIGSLKERKYVIFNVLLSVILVILGMVSLSYASQWERGEKLFRNTLRYEPDNYVALCNLGYALIQQGRYTEAIPHLQKAIEVYPYRAGPYNDLAFSYQSLGRYKEALELYKKSLDISANDPEILSNLAFLYMEMGDYKMAKEYAEKALQIKPSLVNAQKILEMVRDKK